MELSQQVRAAFGALATNVAVVTVPGEQGPHGVTANGWGELPGEPLLLVTLTETSRTLQAVLAAGRFAVNVLRREQEHLARRFAAHEPHPGWRFDGVPHHELAGCPVVDGCLASLACRVEHAYPFGARRIVVGRVEGVEVAAGEPLIFYGRAFR